MSLALRPYQAEAIERVEAAGRNGSRRPLVVHPTGSGKSVIFSHLVKNHITEHGGKALILVHRDELVNQTIDKMRIINPGMPVGVVKAERNETEYPVTVASVQTVSRAGRLQQLGEYHRVIVDEAHHADADSWKRVLDKVGSFSPDGPLTVGFTATPERDKKNLEVWDHVAHFVSIQEMIYQDYLVPVTGQTVDTSADFASVKKSHGDMRAGGIGDVLEESTAIPEIADAWYEYARDRKTIAFTPTVETARLLSEAVRARGGQAEVVSGETPTSQRHAILARLNTGATTFVANCAVLTEGFDEPSVDCILIARPTAFHGLYVQMAGRGLRRHPGKSDCLILDVVGATHRHDLVSVTALGANPAQARGAGEGSETATGTPCELCGRALSMRATARGGTRHGNCAAASTGESDVFAASKLAWLSVDHGYVLPMKDEVIVMAPRDTDDGLWQVATYEKGKIQVIHQSLPIDWAQGIAEDRAKAGGTLNTRNASWRTMRPTRQQLSRLTREGLPESKLARVTTKGEAADLVTRLAGRRAIRKLTRAA